MDVAGLLDELGYSTSASYLNTDQLQDAPEHAQTFRRAAQRCALRGVYVVQEDRGEPRSTSTPVVYVVEATSAEQANEIHRHVWNQNVVPFVIAHLPGGVRLYAGFRYANHGEETARGILHATIAFNQVAAVLADFRADAIDTGAVWRRWGGQVSTQNRVDRRLLQNLQKLGEQLRDDDVPPATAHALIGKFVYLRYLRDRDILSLRKLRAWGIDPEGVFGRETTPALLYELIRRVDDWLNGSVFPLPLKGRAAPKAKHVQQVASVFLGDDPATGQLHLDFRAYDFSFIPVEMLSTIYEQFLAMEGSSKGKGAYYTPLPVVNFMLAELEDHRRLMRRRRVLDPACGSGAFLVQCYRRLVEAAIRSHKGRIPAPIELRRLLTEHIFGIDRDGGACRVAELSLILTMLDYIDPPDLWGSRFKVPTLRGRNILEADFFRDSAQLRAKRWRGFDWVVGNPPWRGLEDDNDVQTEDAAGRSSPEESDRDALAWLQKHPERPVVSNEIAEAFAWKALDHVGRRGVVALLMPASSLFKQDHAFRRAFFTQARVPVVANFANLREVLFAGGPSAKARARVAAAALFFAPARRSSPRDAVMAVYSPFVINQEANRPAQGDRRMQTWSLVLNNSEVRAVPLRAVVGGASLPFKLAMWGSTHDERLLAAVAARFKGRTISAWEDSGRVVVSEGLQLRSKSGDDPINALPEEVGKKALDIKKPQSTNEPVDALPEVVGKKALDIKKLKRLGRVYTFPADACFEVEAERGFVRRRGGAGPLAVCKAPHVVVSGARTFAVYSDEFLVVPPRQIGIAGPQEERSRLIALSLYLTSDFATYFEFLNSPQGGIREGRSTLETLRSLPFPMADWTEAQLAPWVELHRQLTELPSEVPGGRQRNRPRGRKPENDGLLLPWSGRSTESPSQERLEKKVNELVTAAIGLDERERWLVHDLVQVRMCLADGKLSDPALRAPEKEELYGYATMLGAALDEFIEPEVKNAHVIKVEHDDQSGVVSVALMPRDANTAAVTVEVASPRTAGEFRRLRAYQEACRRHWIYFDRNTLLDLDGQTFLIKPMQRVWWTRSQALLDADEIVARALLAEGR